MSAVEVRRGVRGPRRRFARLASRSIMGRTASAMKLLVRSAGLVIVWSPLWRSPVADRGTPGSVQALTARPAALPGELPRPARMAPRGRRTGPVARRRCGRSWVDSQLPPRPAPSIWAPGVDVQRKRIQIGRDPDAAAMKGSWPSRHQACSHAGRRGCRVDCLALHGSHRSISWVASSWLVWSAPR